MLALFDHIGITITKKLEASDPADVTSQFGNDPFPAFTGCHELHAFSPQPWMSCTLRPPSRRHLPSPEHLANLEVGIYLLLHPLRALSVI